MARLFLSKGLGIPSEAVVTECCMDIKTVADMAGVSQATVSRYLNDGYVSAEKRKVIARVIKETGYIPSRQAKQLRTGKSGLVGIVIPKINSASVSRMVAGITQVLNESHYQPLLANTNNNENLEVDYLKIFSSNNNVDGIILIGTIFTDAHMQALRNLTVPIVVLGQEVESVSCVYQDDYQAVRDITEIALRKARHPAFIGVTEKDVSAGQSRHRAFLDACADVGLEVPDQAQVTSEFKVEGGYLACEQLLDHYPAADAIVCASDGIAFGAITCLHEYGLHVPKDVQVTGVGDSEFSLVVQPTLTTIHYPYLTSGAEAARMLVEALKDDGPKGQTTPQVEKKRMSYELMVRSSTS